MFVFFATFIRLFDCICLRRPRAGSLSLCLFPLTVSLYVCLTLLVLLCVYY